jgi:hypothetical protein
MEPRLSRRSTSVFAVLVAASAMAGCIGTIPRPEDASAPRDFYKQVSEKEKPCDRPVQLLPPGAPLGRRYRELANLSATCSPGSVELCERRLKERACALGADALLFSDAESGPNPAAAPIQSLVSRSARALQWESP